MVRGWSAPERKIGDAPAPSTVENTYFSLDLQIPKSSRDHHKTDFADNSCRSSVQVDDYLPKYGFVDRLETIFNRDLRTKNPWFNPDIPSNYDRGRPKKVRIRTVEIQNMAPELPYCRRNNSSVKLGQLHASHCKNSSQETAEVIGDHALQNRQFIIKHLEDKVKRWTQ